MKSFFKCCRVDIGWMKCLTNECTAPRKRSIRSPSPPTVQINSETIQREIEEEKKRLEMREAEKKAIEGELTPENALRERNTWLLEENARLKMELKRKEEELNSALKKLAELK